MKERLFSDKQKAAGRRCATVISTRAEDRRAERIITDPITGWPVLTAGKGSPRLTHKQVQEILADFP